jgi:hypothetical protein
VKTKILLPVLTIGVLCGLPGLALANLVSLTQNRDIHINVSNDAGALYGDPAQSDTYWINAPGGGLNQLHITTNPTAFNGQVTNITTDSSSASGTFWVTTTGGRGFNDSIIIMASVKGPVSDDFSLSIKSSGYVSASSPYTVGAVNETFGKADFLYGPNSAKPGPGTIGVWSLPFVSGQPIGDADTYMMFIDLYVGNNSNRSLTDGGSAKVEFTVSGLYNTVLAFNSYAYAADSNITPNVGAINWTNNLSTNPNAPGQSGFSITSTADAPAPVPLPPAIYLLGSALAGLWFLNRRGAAPQSA